MAFLSLSCFFASSLHAAAEGKKDGNPEKRSLDDIETFIADSLDGGRTDMMEKLLNLPNIEVGKGVTFRPKNDSYEI